MRGGAAMIIHSDKGIDDCSRSYGARSFSVFVGRRCTYCAQFAFERKLDVLEDLVVRMSLWRFRFTVNRV